MITDEVSIYNMALSAVGTRSTVSIPNEKSREAEICRQWFGPVRDQVLRAAPWVSCKAFSRLALIKAKDDNMQWASGDPEPGFSFVYSLPSDLINPRFLVNYERFTMSVYPGNGRCLNTNMPEALLCYTTREENIALWDVQLQMAVVYGLAAYISMPLHGKTQRTNLMIQQANDLILEARGSLGNTDENIVDTIPSWISARGYGAPLLDLRYYYPSGALFSAGAIGV